MRILVIGAGVIGLTSALRLQQAGHTVEIAARDLPEATTSSVAGAVWEPYAVEPMDKATAWGQAAFDMFKELSEDSWYTGVVMRDVWQENPGNAPAPEWAAALVDFKLRDGYYTFTAPVIETPILLRYLQGQFEEHGGQITRNTFASLDDAFAYWEMTFGATGSADEPCVVVNCTGLGSRELVEDNAMYAGKGQIVRVVDPTFAFALMGANGPGENPTYIIPRLTNIVLGGIFDAESENLAPDPNIRTDILHRCAHLALFKDQRFAMSLARLAGDDFAASFAERVDPQYRETPAATLADNPDACGLRPCRSEVRLERVELAPGRVVVHNYGHGGGGVTLSWGCADEVVRLLG